MDFHNEWIFWNRVRVSSRTIWKDGKIMAKLPKIKILKFRSDKTLAIEKTEIDKQVVFTKAEEGFEARADAYMEISQDSFFGFIKGNPFGAFAVRESDPAPMMLGLKKYIGEEFKFKDFVRHENESFRREVARTEGSKQTHNDQIVTVFKYVIFAELLFSAILTLFKGIPF